MGAVAVGGQVATKASRRIDPDDDIQLVRAADPWVSRAAHKLLRALSLWPIDVEGRRCLDAGASTGGFTQVLLSRHAGHVTALDVGHGQLVAEVAADARVHDLPGTNIRDVDAASLGGRFDIVVCDLSFISLTIALPHLSALVEPDGDLVTLVKPQFEVGRERLGRGGVVTSSHEHERVLRIVHEAATGADLTVMGAARSPIAGSEGNVEFLLWLRPCRPGHLGLSADDMLVSVRSDTNHRGGDE